MNLRTIDWGDPPPFASAIVTFLAIDHDMGMTQANSSIVEKRQMLAEMGDETHLVVIWTGQYRTDCFATTAPEIERIQQAIALKTSTRR